MIPMALLGHNVGMFIVGFPIVYIITLVALFVAGNYTINVYGLEYGPLVSLHRALYQ